MDNSTSSDSLDLLLSSPHLVVTFQDVDFLQENLNGGITDPTDDFLGCAKLCEDHPNCTHWSWVMDGQKSSLEPVFDRWVFVSLG